MIEKPIPSQHHVAAQLGRPPQLLLSEAKVRRERQVRRRPSCRRRRPLQLHRRRRWLLLLLGRQPPSGRKSRPSVARFLRFKSPAKISIPAIGNSGIIGPLITAGTYPRGQSPGRAPVPRRRSPGRAPVPPAVPHVDVDPTDPERDILQVLRASRRRLPKLGLGKPDPAGPVRVLREIAGESRLGLVAPG